MIRLSKLFFVYFFFLAIFSVAAQDLYWEQAEPFTPRAGKFPVNANSGDFSVIAWQEVSPNRDASSSSGGLLNIYLAVKEQGKNWEQRGAIAGPYAFLGTEPSILSMVIDEKGRILIAASSGNAQAEILISDNRGRSFTKQTINLGFENSVAPRLYVRADGGYILFITRGQAQSISILYSRSDNGTNWSPFTYFTSEQSLSLNFLPAHTRLDRRDIVFFQSLSIGADSSSTYQLYYKTSDDGGRTWTDMRRFTTFADPSAQNQNVDSFDNQRPHITKFGDNLLLVWERRQSARTPQIYAAIINPSMSVVGKVERVNSSEAYCNNPIGFVYNNVPSIVWFDNRSGNNRIILAQRNDFEWKNYAISSASADASFARPVVSKDSVFIFWQTTQNAASRIYMLAPDHSVAAPRLAAVNFSPTSVNRSEKARVTWNIPADTSGVSSFSWSWSQDPNAVPPEQEMIYNIGNTSNLMVENTATSDGVWYFSVRARDYAGNWSEPAKITYNKKNTPPAPVKINDPQLDDNGYMLSNNFSLSWENSSDPFVAGYTWNLQYLGANTAGTIASPPSGIMGTKTSVQYSNQENGNWAFSVSAIDQAGNIGQPASIIFKTNKFVPYTSVSYIDAQQDQQGILFIRIIGRGFTSNGQIDSIVLEQQGKPDLPASNFNILSDKEISGLTFENMDEGKYRLKLRHSARGWYTAESFIPVVRTGTVKFGDYSNEWKPSWKIPQKGLITFNPIMALAVLLVALCGLGLVATIRGIAGVISEGALIKQEALAIITGDFMPVEKKQKTAQMLKRGTGLTFKLASFTIALILLVIIMISTPMYIIMTKTQRETLLKSLWDRSNVLLDGLASSAKTYLPMAIQSRGERGALELMYLPSNSAALAEADYITITGYGLNSIHTDHVWASNDPDIDSKTDTTELRPGVTRLTDVLTPLYDDLAGDINTRAQKEAGELSQSISTMTEQFLSLALRTDAAGERMRNDIQATINGLNLKLNDILTKISGDIGSYPKFSLDNISKSGNRKYIFYKPIMYRQMADNNFFRGLIRLEVSLDSIINEIYRGQMTILLTIGVVAFVVLLIGIIGAFTFSRLIIKPIKNLVKHIEIIRDTEDKSKLAGVDIQIASKDEIAILGNTINDMTHGLVKAALAASDLSIGKEIQKKFIPLDVDSQGNKQTSGFNKTKNLNFFGYYEGAKGVSGDYFDYKDLDGRYYAMIKCDVAGKGIPAALIMIQVATMFLNYFKQWKPNEKGMHIEEVVYQINDFIEALAFKGRFAAFTLCLFDSETGVVRFCNAGDNIVHLYSAKEGKMKTLTLPQSPATGVLPNFMIESSGGYKVQTLKVEKGDILLLYTDGIEEAKRKFRNRDFKEITCEEGEIGTQHENHLCGQADEEMSPERVEAIINAVMAREVYTLHKYHNAEEDAGDLQFDFSSCSGKVEEIIMAMVSVEKMFRCYKPDNAGEDSRVLVDKKVDEFLKHHFVQYRRYCANTREHSENPAYMYYTHIKEDEQYDDLTILGIKRKQGDEK